MSVDSTLSPAGSTDSQVVVLAIDTAGPVVGVALWAGGRATERTERVRRGAEARLLPWAIELLEERGLVLADVEGIAASKGPGAFTGIRVGLAAAAGLAHGLGVPLWCEMSLTSRARRVEGQVLSMLDARKERVYAALYDAEGALIQGPEDVAPQIAASWVAPGGRVTGEGALVYREILESHGQIILEDAENPGVMALAELGAAALSRGEGGDPVRVEPLYLREPDAKPPKTGV